RIGRWSGRALSDEDVLIACAAKVDEHRDPVDLRTSEHHAEVQGFREEGDGCPKITRDDRHKGGHRIDRIAIVLAQRWGLGLRMGRPDHDPPPGLYPCRAAFALMASLRYCARPGAIFS